MAGISYRKGGDKWEYRFEGAKINGKRSTKKKRCCEGVRLVQQHWKNFFTIRNQRE